jgi:hypothetical protein
MRAEAARGVDEALAGLAPGAMAKTFLITTLYS